MARPRTRPTTPEAQAKRDRERRYYMLSKRPPEMVERHARELQELKDRQFAETEEWIASHTSKAEQAKERKLAKLKALADELGIALDPPSNGHTPPVEQTRPRPVAVLTAVHVPRPAPRPSAPHEPPGERMARPRVLCSGCGAFLPIKPGEDRSSTLRTHYREHPSCESIAKRKR